LAPKTQLQPVRTGPPIQPLRPASSVSTQTGMNQNTILTPKTAKVRTKQTPVRPAGPNIKVGMGQAAGNVQQVVTSAGNK
jgi:polyhomeotic-like protein 1